MAEYLDAYYENQTEPNRSCLLALRSIILAQDENVSETRKWGAPCFSYHKKMFCFLWTDKKTKEPYILFVEGKHLDHSFLEQGNRVRMKILRINPNYDLALEKIRTVLQDALNLYKNGIVSYSTK